MIKLKKLYIAASALALINFSPAAKEFFWEEPVRVSPSEEASLFPITARSDDGSFTTATWEVADYENKTISIKSSSSSSGYNWSSVTEIASSIPFSGTVPDIISTSINKDGIVATSVVTSENTVDIYVSQNRGTTFTKSAALTVKNTVFSARIFSLSSGSFMLFLSSADKGNFSLLSSTSQDGITWTSPSPFQGSTSCSNPMVPCLLSSSGSDIVVFQAYNVTKTVSGSMNVFQLYSTFSTDGGKKWKEASLLTGEGSFGKQTDAQSDWQIYQNQSPALLHTKDGNYIAWERRRYSSTNSSIWFAKLTSGGKIEGEACELTENAQTFCPDIFEFDGNINIIWVDTRSGSEQVYFKQREGVLWGVGDEQCISRAGTESLFPHPVIGNNGKSLSFIWQEKSIKNGNTEKNGKIVHTLPDSSCNPPEIIPLNFKSGERYGSGNPKLSIKLSEDSSGAGGFSYLWTKNKDERPSTSKADIHMPFETTNPIEANFESDGQWYFKAKQMDKAGNWSLTKTIEFNFDITPPSPVKLDNIETDEYGFVPSNTWTLSWKNNANDSDIDHYEWVLRKIDSISLPRKLYSSDRHPMTLAHRDALDMTDDFLDRLDVQDEDGILTSYRYSGGNVENEKVLLSNIRNGAYTVSVRAVDKVGNKSEESTFSHPLIFNKYNPYTYISKVEVSGDRYGNVNLAIRGTGFLYDGRVSEIYIDSDGEEPYDRILKLSEGNYTINSDSLITGISVSDFEEGLYRVGLYHSDRGLYFPEMRKEIVFQINESGTVKIQNDYTYKPDWQKLKSIFSRKISFAVIILAVLFILALLGFMASVHGLAGSAAEAKAITREVTALITGGSMPKEQKKNLKKRTSSLKYKLMGFSILLVIVIIFMITLPLSYYMTSSQKETLSENLGNRVDIVLDSLASQGRTYLPPDPDITELSMLSEQAKEGLGEDLEWATVTGFAAEGNDDFFDYVWITNDKDISMASQTGNERISSVKEKSSDGEDIKKIVSSFSQEELKEKIELELYKIDAEIAELNYLNNYEKDARKRNAIDKVLNSLANEYSGSYPDYKEADFSNETKEYIFYKPVLKRPGSQEKGQNYIRGLVLLKTNTASLVTSIKHSVNGIFIICGIIIIIAIIIGFLGSLILASIIIKPIKILSEHVAMIRDTEDKESLAGKDISLKTHDEIAMLGDTINEMTHSLVQAAIASKNLTIGREIQTKFLPLQTDMQGITTTTGKLKAKGAEFFSYYAGADELSGDYFDYKQIDENNFAIIKCDISGHGVPAALIMVEVATLFLNNFKNWSMTNPAQGTNLAPVVGKINDLLESRGFKGRFAAFTLCLLNTKTGEVYFCNAGDNLVELYDSREKRKRTITLPETPAAGMFSTDLIDMKGGYKVSRYVLKKDDVLFLYTDGIEEAKRKFRNEEYKVIKCEEEGLHEGDIHENHKVGETTEEMSPERVTQIIESVYARKVYTLEKYHNPIKDEKFVFDFSKIEPTAENAIMALVSVEKIFRMYKPAFPAATDRVKVDRKIDDFLSKYFKQYDFYSSKQSEVENEPQFVYYEEVLEDPQYDDLTLIAIKKD